MNINCKISNSDSTVPLGLEIWIDDLLIFNFDHVEDPVDVNYDLDDSEGEHELRFVLKNKTAEHTRLDEDGNIVKDTVLTISDLKFDDIELAQLFYDHAVYTHNFNGSGEPIQDKFYGSLGCNGTVSMKFTTPVYLWLLENL